MNWTISLGSITAGPPGSPVTVTNVGTSGATVLDIALPKGDKGQGVDEYSAEVEVPFALRMSLDLSLGSAFNVTLSSSAVMANPTNATEGMGGYLVVKQDSAGSRNLWFGTDWLFPEGDALLSAEPNAIDLIAYAVRADGKLIATISRGFAAAEQPGVFQISDLGERAVIDLNANSGLTITDGAVSAWTSTAGSLVAQQNTPGFRPVRDLTSLDGAPAVEFDGIDDFMDIAGFGLLEPGYSIFYLGRLGQSQSPQPTLLRDTGNEGGEVFNSSQRLYFYDGGSIYTNNVGVDATTLALFSIDTAGAAMNNAFKNGVVNVGAGSGEGSDVAGNHQLGHVTNFMRLGSAGGSRYGTWQMGRLVIAYVADEHERQRIEGRIMRDHGLQGLLPDGHPYKTEEPLAL